MVSTKGEPSSSKINSGTSFEVAIDVKAEVGQKRQAHLDQIKVLTARQELTKINLGEVI